MDTSTLCRGGVANGKDTFVVRAGVPAPVRRAGFAVELVRAGRTPGELAREFECSASAIRNWVRQSDRDEGRREDGLTTAEREDLRRLRRENRQLREEREILKKSRGLVCPGDRHSTGEVFELVKATRATLRILRPSSRAPSDRPGRKPARPGLVPATRTSRARSRLRGGVPTSRVGVRSRGTRDSRASDPRVPLDSGVFPGLAAFARPRARLSLIAEL